MFANFLRATAPLAAVFMIVASLQAEACPEFVKNLKTSHLPTELPDLCSAYDRYHAALEKIEAQGVTPATRIADLHARRMINGPNWEEKRASHDYSPWTVYDPTPLTWQQFEKAAALIDGVAKKNLESQRFAPISFRLFFKTHIAELKNLSPKAGFIRRHGELGLSLSRDSAVTRSQAAALQSTEYPGLVNPNVPLIQWHPTQCLEDKDPSFVSAFNANMQRYGYPVVYLNEWPDIDKNAFFNHNGVEKQCGYLLYADLAEVRPQLKKWAKDINSVATTWGTENASGDPIFLAARAQKWLIAIHPFVDGNGRMSRLIMDLILESIGLPSPVLKDHNDDVYTPEVEWANETGRGVLRAIQIAEKCAANIQLPECKIVSTTPPGNSSK